MSRAAAACVCSNSSRRLQHFREHYCCFCFCGIELQHGEPTHAAAPHFARRSSQGRASHAGPYSGEVARQLICSSKISPLEQYIFTFFGGRKSLFRNVSSISVHWGREPIRTRPSLVASSIPHASGRTNSALGQSPAIRRPTLEPSQAAAAESTNSWPPGAQDKTDRRPFPCPRSVLLTALSLSPSFIRDINCICATK